MNPTDPPRCFTRTCGKCSRCLSSNREVNDLDRARWRNALAEMAESKPETARCPAMFNGIQCCHDAGHEREHWGCWS